MKCNECHYENDNEYWITLVDEHDKVDRELLCYICGSILES
jgi:hypothetical protein